MSELKVYVPQDGPYGLKPEEGGKLVEEETCYLKSGVDAVIAEKDRALEFAKALTLKDIEIIKEKDKEIAELKAKLEDAKATAYAESVDAGMRERKLKRALWIAHEYKAKFKRWWLHLALDCEASEIRPNTKTINRIIGKIRNCEKSEHKCRAKAEEYK